MTINQAILWLVTLRNQHGDIEVYADCPACKTSFAVGVVVAAPETVRLRDAVGQPTTDTAGAITRAPNSSSSS